MNLLSSKVEAIVHHGSIFLETLALPSKDEYITAAYTAVNDVRAATASSWNLTYLTFRPLFILLGILGRYVAVVLKVIAQHSIAHGWVALREGFFQLRTASIWFARFQRDLPTSAKYAEIGVLSVLAILWMLRRRFQKYRYGERVMKWYRNKKQRALNEYEKIVNKAAETSLLLAMLLPHILYVVFIVAMKRLLPSVVTYLATRTYLISFISIWRPLYQTLCVVGQINHNIVNLVDDSDEADPKKKSKSLVPSRIKQQQKHKEQLREHKDVAVDLLKYWVVYAILLAIAGTSRLLPIVRSLLPLDETKTAKSWRFFGSKTVKSGLLARLRLTANYVEEIRLVFFVWLLLMPQSFLRTNEAGDKAKASKKAKSNRPLDILYNMLSPSVTSAIRSSAFLSGKVEGSSYGAKTIQFLQSLLSALVFTRVLKEEWKDFIIRTILESTALLPAAITMLMPGYFTSYGVIYVSLIVPAGYSIEAINKSEKSTSSLDALVLTMQDASRYLQFWVASSPLTTLLCWFEPVLAWVPLSTHVTWLLWACVQMKSPTHKIYNLIEGELIVFGILHSYNELACQDVNDTLIFRSVRGIIAFLPSNVKSGKESEANETSREKQE
ncbi:hypothetical protein ACHAWO_009915 [Cyclotella atomus]|uniref:Uncharacterized protein n=1 Tax=Cyclotella atomus TaxID=382360 RepID=A0ABD3N0T3_9STRA